MSLPRHLLAVLLVLVAVIGLGTLAASLPCDGGFWTGAKIALGGICPLPTHY